MTQAIPTAGLGRTGLKVTRLGFGTAISGNHDDERWDELRLQPGRFRLTSVSCLTQYADSAFRR
jgi:hypothetical protein